MNATITAKVSFINQPKPGKKKGSIKTDSNLLIGCWPDKLALFQAGGTYEIEYSEQTVNGVTYKNVEKAKQVAAPTPATNGAAGGGYNTYRQTDPLDAERMFVTAVVRAAIQAGVLPIEATNLANAVNECRRAWNATFGAKQAAITKTSNPDMEDSIPF